MSLEQEQPATGSVPAEKVNDFLRRMRESKRVTLEKVARDTKLNLDFLHAIEEGDYGSLPAETYVRIYLRSFSKYLQIDPNDTIARYEQETQPVPQEEAKTPTRGFAILARRSKIKPVAVVVLILGVIVALSFLRSGSGPAVTDDPIISADSARTPVSKTALADSAQSKIAAVDSSTKSDSSAVSIKKDSSLTLFVQCKTESCWVKVYSDKGNPWRQVMAKGEQRTFQARSTFYVSAGRLSTLQISLNGQSLALPNIRGIARLAVTPEGVRRMNWSDWIRVFPHERGSSSTPESNDTSRTGSST